MKKIVSFILISFLSINIYAQENIISLITTGTDSNKDKAVNKALRNAVEQAFGSFLVSKSTLINDQLASDEILTVSSGNIVSYEIVSTIDNPVSKEVTATVNSKVSLVKLKSFIESKGIEVDFKGKLFAQNIMLQEFYEQNEIKALKELNALMKEFNDKCFDYTVEAKEPVKNGNDWNIELITTVMVNDNFFNLRKNFISTLKSVSLSQEQAMEYKKLGKDIFIVIIDYDNTESVKQKSKKGKSETTPIFLRKEESMLNVLDIVYNYNNQLASFEIDNSVNKITLLNSKWKIIQNNFNPILNNKESRDLMVGGKLTVQETVLPPRSLFEIPFVDPVGYIDYKRNSIYFTKTTLSVLNKNRKQFNGYSTNSLAGAVMLTLTSENLKSQDGVSAQFSIIDTKSLEDIQKIDKYKVYPKSLQR